MRPYLLHDFFDSLCVSSFLLLYEYHQLYPFSVKTDVTKDEDIKLKEQAILNTGKLLATEKMAQGKILVCLSNSTLIHNVCLNVFLQILRI